MTTPFSYKPYGAASATPIDILIGSASGISADTAEIQTTYNSIYVGEVVSRITQSKRPVSFRIPVVSDTPANLNTAIRTYSALFTPSENPAQFICGWNTPERYLNVYPSGSPEVEYQTDTVAFLTVNLVAPNPYWYDSSTPTTYASGQTITNTGMYPAPVRMTVDTGSTAVTLSVGGTVVSTISRRGTESIEGASISVSDSAVSATISGTNALSRFDISSDWFMVPPGQSVVTGASGITIQQRWSAP